MSVSRAEGMRNGKTIRYALACVLFLLLCAPSGCKKEDKPTPTPKTTADSSPAPTPVAPQSQARSKPLVSITDRNAEPTVLASPPADISP